MKNLLAYFDSLCYRPKYKGQNKFYDHCLNLGPHKVKPMVAYATLLLENVIPRTKECVKKGSEWAQRKSPPHCTASYTGLFPQRSIITLG